MKNKILKELFWVANAKAWTLLFFFGLNILLARVLLPETYGKFSYLLSVLTICVLVSSYGINGAAKAYLARSRDSQNTSAVLLSGFILRLVFSFAGGIISIVVVNLMFRNVYDPVLLGGTVFFFVTAAGLIEYIKQAFNGLHRNFYSLLVNFTEYGLKLSLTAGALILMGSREVVAVLICYTLALACGIAVGVVILFKNYILFPIDVNSIKQRAAEIFRYSGPMFVISIGFAIASELDTVMLGWLAGAREVAMYAPAKQTVMKLPHIATMFAMAVMPLFGKVNRENIHKMHSLYKKTLLVNGVIFFLLGALILGGSWFFVPLFFGQEYKESVLIFNLLVPFMIMFSFSVLFSSLLDYQLKAGKRAMNLTVSILCNIILNYLLIPRYGAAGAAVATVVSYIPNFVLNAAETRRVFRNLARNDNHAGG